MDSIDLVLNVVRETFGDVFKTYYNGDPEVIPRFNLPAIIVTQLRDDTTEAEMGEDDVTDQIRIKVLLDKAEDYNGGKIDPLNLTDKRLRDFVGHKSKQGDYEPTTIKYALRTMMLDGIEAIAPTMDIEYGVNPRETLGDAEGNVDWTAEAWVTFDIKYSVQTYQ